MSNEKYINYYVEILTGTMTDAIMRNVSLQANAKVSDEVISEIGRENEQLKLALEELKTSNDSVVQGHLDRIKELEKQLFELTNMRSEYENVKHQVNHLDTFRNELNKERDEHKKTCEQFEQQVKELNSKIDYLQLTPAKRKKLDDVNKNVTTLVAINSDVEDLTKDGGSF
jgi:chromosome segregation ATPase